jgi:MinD superfamily P-loop ATPase
MNISRPTFGRIVEAAGVVVVTEPSEAGVHDLTRALD